MRFTAIGLRVGFIGFLYTLWTIIMWFNIPEGAPTQSNGFGGLALIWILVTTGLLFYAIVFMWNYLWVRSQGIANYLNRKLDER